MTTGKALNGKPYAGNPHVRFDEGEVASAATPRRGSLLYKVYKYQFGCRMVKMAYAGVGIVFAMATRAIAAYAPVPGGYAIHNGNGEFNRPLYGWHGDDRELNPCKSLPWTTATGRRTTTCPRSSTGPPTGIS